MKDAMKDFRQGTARSTTVIMTMKTNSTVRPVLADNWGEKYKHMISYCREQTQDCMSYRQGQSHKFCVRVIFSLQFCDVLLMRIHNKSRQEDKPKQ